MTNKTEKTISDLTIDALHCLLENDFGISLPPDVWKEQEITAKYLENMANGKLEPKAYLNSLWTGASKTSLMVCYVGVHVRLPEYEDVGILICVPFLNQIPELIKQTKLAPSQYAVYVSKDATYEENGGRKKYNDLGNPRVNEAQVLFTTQQMIETRLAEGKNFSDLDYMHYRGRPRKVKIWDEALVPWEELILGVFTLAAMPGLVGRLKNDLARKLLDIAAELKDKKEGLYQFPNLEQEYGVSWHDLQNEVLTNRDRHPSYIRRAAYTLWKISGKQVRITRDVDGNTILDWKQSLPDDFFPVVVFDASGRVRSMYDFYAGTTDKLEEITTLERDFSHLTFHHINLGGGKDPWRKQTPSLLNLTKTLINQEPDRKTLVIVHKPDTEGVEKGKIPDIEKALGRLCPNAAWLTWGEHKQTSAFRDYDRLVLPGLLYLPRSVIEARTYGSLQTPTREDMAEDYFREIERGEIRSDLLQAVGRIARGTKDGKSIPADIFIVASDNKNGSIQALLQETFPGSHYKKLGNPTAKPKDTTTKAEQLAEIVRDHFTKTPEMNLPFNNAGARLGLRKQNLKQLRNHRDIKALLTELGIEEAANDNRSYKTHWRKKAA
jgi:hypothetical protein